MEITVSYGEILDKYSILDIKRDKLKNNQHVVDELKVLEPNVEVLFQDRANKFYYHLLKIINLQIWELSDFIRDHPDDTKACIDIIHHNDRRFRVKNKINRASRIKEQKGYPLKKCIFHGHTESGDQLTNIGIVRYLSTIYDQVTVVSKSGNTNLVKSLYIDDPCIQVIVRDTCYHRRTDLSDIPQDVTKMLTGIFGNGWMSTTPFYDCFYKQLSIDPSYRFLYNYLPRDLEAETKLCEKILPKDCTKYVFVHARDGVHFNNRWDNDTFVFSVGYNIYPEGHKWHSQWNKETGNLLLLSYCLLMERADVVFVSDSAFYCLSAYLNMRPEQELVCHQCRSGKAYHNPEQKWNYQD